MTAGAQVNTYTVTPIIDDTEDQFLINPWGMSRPVDPSLPEGEWWLSDNGTGFTTLYDVSKSGPASLLPLVITIPSANGTSVGAHGHGLQQRHASGSRTEQLCLRHARRNDFQLQHGREAGAGRHDL
jgi:hypothetical protein